MRDRDFEQWLRLHYRTSAGTHLDPRSQSSTLSNCRRVERGEGDLDRHYTTDGLTRVLRRLTDGTAKIRAEGNRERVLSSLKSAVSRYEQFCREWPPGSVPAVSSAPPAVAPAPSPRPRGRQAVGTAKWPRWDPPSADDVLALGRAVARHVRFLAPAVVQAVVEDNERHRTAWDEALAARGIAADRYCWERGACAFPGVRRYAGSAEIARHRKKAGTAPETEFPPDALVTDDNTYPKHLWSYVLRGRPFQQFGPAGYELAHLFDHKDYKNRLGSELEGGEALGARVPYGLFSCASNTVFVPKSLLRPTDHAGLLRGLLQRKALSLYGDFCTLVPPPAAVLAAPMPAWEVEAFEWAPPVEAAEPVERFLAFRGERMHALLQARPA
ncbi:MAG: hypothetical protein KDB73_02435 [Planctomycetes bacterium]|nr:hypothetical protein [Planctomycetota bacterium]